MPKAIQQRIQTKTKPVLNGVMGRLRPVEFDEEEGISVCLYGGSGSGKTSFWSTFPGPILSIVCSGSKKPGELRSVSKENRKKIQTITLEKISDIQEIVNHQRNTGEFKTVVQDHATGLQDLILKEILGLDEIPAQLGWGIANQQTWGQVSLQTKESLRAILNLFCHRVIVCQERLFEPREENELGESIIGPALTPSSCGWLSFTCDYVVQTFKEQKTETKEIKLGNEVKKSVKKIPGVNYCLRTGPSADYMTKFRVPKGTYLPEYIVDPDFDQLIQLIRGDE